MKTLELSTLLNAEDQELTREANQTEETILDCVLDEQGRRTSKNRATMTTYTDYTEVIQE